MRCLLGIVAVALVLTGAALANEGFDGWGTQYYDQVIDVGFDGEYRACQISYSSDSGYLYTEDKFDEYDFAWSWMFE